MEMKNLIVSRELAQAQDKLYAMIYVLMAGSFDTMDVLQETNATILKNADKYDASRPALPWFKAFAMNQVLYYRRVRRDEKLLFDTEMINDLAAILDEYESTAEEGVADYVDLLEKCLEKLPPWQRELLKERYQDGSKVSQMAAKLLMSRVSLSVLMFRIRKVLQSCIENASQRGDRPVKDNQLTGNGFINTLEAVLDGNASHSEAQELLGEMRRDPDLKRLYVMHASMHAALKCRSKRLFPEFSQGAENRVPEPIRKPHRKFSYSVAAAVCVLIVLGGLWIRHSGFLPFLNRGNAIRVMVYEQGENEWLHQITPLDLQAYEENLGFDEFHASEPEMIKYEPGVIENPGAAIEIIAMEGDDLQGRHLVKGDKVWREHLNLPAAGSMKFQFEDGATVTLIGPATLDIADSNSIILRRGAIMVECNDQMLALKMPQADVHIRNAIFCADGSNGQKSDVMVLSGFVKLIGASEEPVHYLTAKEGLRLADNAAPIRFRLMPSEQRAREKFLTGTSKIVMTKGRL